LRSTVTSPTTACARVRHRLGPRLRGGSQGNGGRQNIGGVYPKHGGGGGGGGECAAECVATGAARRRRGQHVALNVICRRGMRPEAEDCSRQGCSRARSHHHLGWARHRRTPTPPGTRAWPPRQGVHALAFLLQLSYLTQVFECEHNKYAGLHSDATCSSAAPKRVSHLASASRNCSQRSVAL